MSDRQSYWTHLYNITRRARLDLGYSQRNADRVAKEYADKWTAKVFDKN